jgi:calcium-dependent protein kinase
MGACFSTIKVSGSNSNNNVNHSRKEPTKPQTKTTKATTATRKKQEVVHHHQNNKNVNNEAEKKLKVKEKQSSKAIPCGKRTDFGYDKDFDMRYTIGKLLGHGQFGYTYVAIDKANGDRVAVKRIEKNKVFFFGFPHHFVSWGCFVWRIKIKILSRLLLMLMVVLLIS